LGGKNILYENKFIDEHGNDPAMAHHNESCSAPYRAHSLLCAACAVDFSRSGLGGKCKQCPDPAANITIAVFGILFAIVGVVVFVFISLKDKGEVKPKDGAQFIMLSFIQTFSLVATFPIAWPQIFLTLFQIGGAVTVLGQHLVNLKCLYPTQTDADVFFTTRILWSMLPILMSLGCLLTWYLMFRCNKTVDWWRKAKSSIVALLFLIWPGLCSETFGIFACRDVCGKSVMIVDLDEPCWEGRHADFVVLGGLMMAFYVVGFPLLALITIMRMHTRAVKQQREIHGLKGYLTWGFFISAYHPKVWWWESTVAVRKIVIAAIGVFGTDMGDMQIHLIMFLMVVVMLITAIVQPFGHHLLLQCLELGTLGVTWATLWAGSVFNTHPRCEDGKGGTLGWCDALSVLVSLMVITSVVMCISIIVYYTKQDKINRCWGKYVQARINHWKERRVVQKETGRRSRMEVDATMFDNPCNDETVGIEMPEAKNDDVVTSFTNPTLSVEVVNSTPELTDTWHSRNASTTQYKKPPTQRKTPKERVKAMFDYEAADSDELSMKGRCCVLLVDNALVALH